MDKRKTPPAKATPPDDASGATKPSPVTPAKTLPTSDSHGARGPAGATKVKPPVYRVRSSYFTWCQINRILPCDESLRWYLEPIQAAFAELDEFVPRASTPPEPAIKPPVKASSEPVPTDATPSPPSAKKAPESTPAPAESTPVKKDTEELADVSSAVKNGMAQLDKIPKISAAVEGRPWQPKDIVAVAKTISTLLAHATTLSCIRWDGTFRALMLAPLIDEETQVIGDLMLAMSIMLANGTFGNVKNALALAPCRSWQHQETRYTKPPGLILKSKGEPAAEVTIFDAVCMTVGAGTLPEDGGGKLVCADLLIAPWLDDRVIDCRPIEDAWAAHTDPRGFGTLRGWHADASHRSSATTAATQGVPSLEAAAAYCRFAAGWNEEVVLANEFALMAPTEDVCGGQTVAAAVTTSGAPDRRGRRVRLEYTANGMFRVVYDLYTGAAYLNDHYEPNADTSPLGWVPIGLKATHGAPDDASIAVRKIANALKNTAVDAVPTPEEAPAIHYPPPVEAPPESGPGKRRLTELCRDIVKLRTDLESCPGLAKTGVEAAIEALGYMLNDFAVSTYGGSQTTKIVDSMRPLEEDLARGLACLDKARKAAVAKPPGSKAYQLDTLHKALLKIIGEIEALAKPAPPAKPSPFQVALVACLINLLRYEAYQGWMANDLRQRKPPSSGSGSRGGLTNWGLEPGSEKGAGDHMFNDLWGGFGVMAAIGGLPVSLRLERRQQLRNGLALRGYKWIDTSTKSHPNPLGSAGPHAGDPNSQFWPWAKRATPVLVALASAQLSAAPIGSVEARSCRALLVVHETVVEDEQGRAENAIAQLTAKTPPSTPEPTASDAPTKAKEPHKFKPMAIASDAARAAHHCIRGIVDIWQGSGEESEPLPDPHELVRVTQAASEVARKAQEAVTLAAPSLDGSTPAQVISASKAAAEAVALAAKAVASAAGTIHGSRADLGLAPPSAVPTPASGAKAKTPAKATPAPLVKKPAVSTDMQTLVGEALTAAAKACEAAWSAAKAAGEPEAPKVREHQQTAEAEKRKVDAALKALEKARATVVASLADTFYAALHVLATSSLDRNVLALRRHGDGDVTKDDKGGTYTMVVLGSETPITDVGFNTSTKHHADILRECELVAQQMVEQCLARDLSLAAYQQTGQISTGGVGLGGGFVGAPVGPPPPPPVARPILGITNIGNSCYLASALQLCARLGLHDNYCLANDHQATLQGFTTMLGQAPADLAQKAVYIGLRVCGPPPAQARVAAFVDDARDRALVSLRLEAATRLLLASMRQQAAAATYAYAGDPTANPAVVYVTSEPRAVRAELGWPEGMLGAQHDAVEAMERILDAFDDPARLGARTATSAHLETLNAGTFPNERASRLHFMLQVTKTVRLGVAGAAADTNMRVQAVDFAAGEADQHYARGQQRQYHKILQIIPNRGLNRTFAQLLATFLDHPEELDEANPIHCELPDALAGPSTFYPNALCVHETAQFVSTMPQHMLVQIKRFYNDFFLVDAPPPKASTPTPSTASSAPTSAPVSEPVSAPKKTKRWFTNKVQTRVTDLHNVTIGGTAYRLVGFVRHHGDSWEGGHYTAWIHLGTRWFHLDDPRVLAYTDNDPWPAAVRREAEVAYLLLYEQAPAVGGPAHAEADDPGEDEEAAPDDEGPSEPTEPADEPRDTPSSAPEPPPSDAPDSSSVRSDASDVPATDVPAADVPADDAPDSSSASQGKPKKNKNKRGGRKPISTA